MLFIFLTSSFSSICVWSFYEIGVFGKHNVENYILGSCVKFGVPYSLEKWLQKNVMKIKSKIFITTFVNKCQILIYIKKNYIYTIHIMLCILHEEITFN